MTQEGWRSLARGASLDRGWRPHNTHPSRAAVPHPPELAAGAGVGGGGALDDVAVQVGVGQQHAGEAGRGDGPGSRRGIAGSQGGKGGSVGLGGGAGHGLHGGGGAGGGAGVAAVGGAGGGGHCMTQKREEACEGVCNLSRHWHTSSLAAPPPPPLL